MRPTRRQFPRRAAGSARRAFCTALSAVKGGRGGRVIVDPYLSRIGPSQGAARGASDQLRYVDTSKMTSISTGVPRGRLATPYTRRQGLLSFPKTSLSNSEAASATFG